MTKSLKAPEKTSHRPLFLRKKLCFTPKKARKTLKTPPAVTYRGNLFEKKFTGKETDPETGLYYYGARYLDPKTSRWLSGDPALGEYLPSAPVNDEAKKRNGNLPGQGGVFNYVNLHVYHYAVNNPVKYVDPDGMWLAIKARLDRIGTDAKNIFNNNPSVGHSALELAFQKVKSEIHHGAFKKEAASVASSELNKTISEQNRWAENEQTRLDALLKIRDESESKYESIKREVEDAYQNEYKKTHFNDRGKVIHDDREKKVIADKKANQKLDELIKKELSSYEIPGD
jgi:RHS repeat-associated protein